MSMGRRDLYMTEEAYSMLLMKVVGEEERGVSTTYRITVGKALLSNSWIICPPADQVNDSI
jgi:hypothetical protein